MSNRIALGVLLFILGYAYGSGVRPLAEEALMISITSFILGAGAYRLFISIRRNTRAKMLKLLQVSGQADEAGSASPIRKLGKGMAVDCDFCQGEKEILIAGRKEIMPCPKCSGEKKSS